MGIRLLNMGKISDKIRQDVAKMRKMRDVSSVFTPPGGVRHRPTRQQAGEPGPRGGDGEGKPSPRIGGDWFIRELIYTL